MQDVWVGGVIGVRSSSIRSAWSVTAKLAAVEVFSILRMEVGDSFVEVAVFGAHLEAVAAFEKTIVNLWIGDVGTGELRICGLPPKLREPRNCLAVQSAVDAWIARDIGNIEVCQQIVGTDIYRRLSALRPRKSQPKLQN